MRIRFFNLSDGSDAPHNLDFFVMENGSVWRNNFESCESQCAVVGFDDFVMECPGIGWEVIATPPTTDPA